MSLRKAREVFTRDYAGMIQSGRSIKVAGDTRPGTVADLFEGYVRSLRCAGKPSAKEVEKAVSNIAATLGRTRPARDIEPPEIVDAIRPISDRGKTPMAHPGRTYTHSANDWGIKAEHYYRTTPARRFRLSYNPAAVIPSEPKTVGTRWLNEDEFVRLYRWLECPDAPVHPPYTRAVRILMLTGQRVEEIARLHVDQWDAKERIIDWSKTKNGKPPALPVPTIAAELLESIPPHAHGGFFPSATDPSKPGSHGTLHSLLCTPPAQQALPSMTNPRTTGPEKN